jgi:hypothetical protein
MLERTSDVDNPAADFELVAAAGFNAGHNPIRLVTPTVDVPGYSVLTENGAVTIEAQEEEEETETVYYKVIPGLASSTAAGYTGFGDTSVTIAPFTLVNSAIVTVIAYSSFEEKSDSDKVINTYYLAAGDMYTDLVADFSFNKAPEQIGTPPQSYIPSQKGQAKMYGYVGGEQKALEWRDDDAGDGIRLRPQGSERWDADTYIEIGDIDTS